MKRHEEVRAALARHVLGARATLDANERRAALERSSSPPFRAYLEKVWDYSYKVTDEDIDALERAGFTEDQIFEATVCAAVGEAARRVSRVADLLKDVYDAP